MKKSLPLSFLSFLIIILFPLRGISQNKAPVAVDDSLVVYTYLHDTTIYFEVLLNDFDPENYALRICDVKRIANQQMPLFNDTAIYFNFTSNFLNLIELEFDYRICRVDDPEIVSNYARLNVNPQLNENAPIAHNDTIEGIIGYSYQVNAIANDNDPNNDSIFFTPNQNYVINDSMVSVPVGYFNDANGEGYDVFSYRISNNPDDYLSSFDAAFVVTKVKNYQWYDSLNINNVNARFNSFGNHFWNMQNRPQYIVPAGSGVSSLFSSTFWIGGMDEEDKLHLAGERYRQSGEDFWVGPVSETYDSLYDEYWLHIWKLDRAEIEYHKAHWWEAGYEALPDIHSWPAHGDTSLNQTANIAPFEDYNSNGIYEPMLGDAPVIKGDQALYFVMNDARKPHTETEGLPLGIEIHAMAYAYNMPDDSALWSTTFLQYKIINKSDTLYSDAYTGFFVDTDLGNAFDDYIGCNVQGGYFYSYNGNSIDGIPGQPGVYGENPPAIAVLFLGGPLLGEDGLDNPKYDMSGNQICDESINGLNFGDSIVDNERLGMTGFMYHNNGGASYMSDPYIASEYYTYLKSFWKDSTKLLYGGNGHLTSGAVGPECRFIFPGDTDPCNWGSGGIPPNAGLNTPGNYWTEESVGNNPSDRRGLGSSGPFTFAPGQEETLDVAFVWARAYDGNPWSSAELLEGYCSYIKNKFENDETFFIGVNQHTKNDEHVLIYPNPATEFIRVSTPGNNRKGLVSIFNSRGVLIFSKATDRKTDYRIDVQGWGSGLYFVRYISDNGLLTGSFIKV